MKTNTSRRRHDDDSSSESDEQPEDHVEPYIYEYLNAPRSTRLIKLQPGTRKDEIVCKIVEVDLDPQYTADVRRVEKMLKEREQMKRSGKHGAINGAPDSIRIHVEHEQGLKSKAKTSHIKASYTDVPALGDPGVPAEYEALSWNWGTTPWDAQVKIDKDGVRYYFNVPKSIIGAFKALRNKKTERVLWVDAISIDQSDPLEKSQQVPMMSEIYGGAKSVCVWLGEGDEDSKMAFDFIRNEIIQLEDFDKLCESPGSAPKWNAMFNLMKRPWFSRRWIVQEIALAREARLYCGRKNIPWQDFADAVQLFVSVESATHRLSEVMKIHDSFYHVPRWFEYVSKLGASLLVDATGTLFRYSKIEWPETKHIPGAHTRASLAIPGATPSKSPAYPRGLSGRSNRQALLSLEHLVSTLSIFQATNPRDIIYALLAVAKDTNPVPCKKPPYLTDALKSITVGMKLQARPYIVDYTKRYVDICADYVQFAINQQADRTRALDIICRPWAPEPERAEKNRNRSDANAPLSPFVGEDSDDNDQERMPSWIPQLTRASHNMIRHADSVEKMGRINADPLVGLPELNQRNYNAAGDKSADLARIRIKKRRRYHSIEILGFVLDRVEAVDKQSQNGNIPLSWFEMADINARPFNQQYEDQQMKDSWEEFWRTLVADRGQNGRNPPAYYARAFGMSLQKGLLATGSLNTTDMIDHGRCSVVSEFFRRVQAVIWNRCLVRTEAGRLGIVNEGVEKGDLVCIMDGCSVPVILRPMKKERSDIEEDMRAEKEELEQWSRVAQRRHRMSKQPRTALSEIKEREQKRLAAEKSAQQSGRTTPQIKQRPESGPDAITPEDTVPGVQQSLTDIKTDGRPSQEGLGAPRVTRSRSISTKRSRKEIDTLFTGGQAQPRDIIDGVMGYEPEENQHQKQPSDTSSVPLKPSQLSKERIRVWKEYYCQLMGEAFIYGVMDGEAIALYNRYMAQRGESASEEKPKDADKYAGYKAERVVDGVKVMVADGSLEDQFPMFRNQVFELR